MCEKETYEEEKETKFRTKEKRERKKNSRSHHSFLSELIVILRTIDFQNNANRSRFTFQCHVPTNLNNIRNQAKGRIDFQKKWFHILFSRHFRSTYILNIGNWTRKILCILMYVELKFAYEFWSSLLNISCGWSRCAYLPFPVESQCKIICVRQMIYLHIGKQTEATFHPLHCVRHQVQVHHRIYANKKLQQLSFNLLLCTFRSSFSPFCLSLFIPSIVIFTSIFLVDKQFFWLG